MKLNISENKLHLILSKNFDPQKIDQKLIKKFKNWLQNQTWEFSEEERTGELFDQWLLDITKHFR